ncbi:MAG TPA: hypothetical protein VFB22_15005 [Candidatus Baltobacteraceae bacterium]|nr:hypothetical protein [Candidatus Baltobacteraceae bacterium]
MSRTLALAALVVGAVLGVAGPIALAQTAPQSVLRTGGGVRPGATPAALSRPTPPPLPLGDLSRPQGTRRSIGGDTGLNAELAALAHMHHAGNSRLTPYHGKLPPVPKLTDLLHHNVRWAKAANGASIVLTGSTNQPYLDDQTVGYGTDVYWLCENLAASTTYRYIVYAPDGYAYIVTPDNNAGANFTTDAQGRCAKTQGGKLQPFWAGVTLQTPAAAGAAYGATDPGTGTDPAYSGVWTIAVQNMATTNFDAVAYTVVIGTLNFSTYSDSGYSHVANDFSSGSTVYVSASGLNPAHFYAFGFVNSSSNGMPCLYSIPSGSQNSPYNTCFLAGATGILPTSGKLSGQWSTSSSGANASGTMTVQLFDATTADLISTQQVSLNPSTMTWNTLVPYSGSTANTGTNLNDTFATDGLLNISGTPIVDQSTTGLNISGTGTVNGHVYQLTVSNANSVVMSSTTSDTAAQESLNAPQFFSPVPTFTATGAAFSQTGIAWPINSTNLTAFGATQIPFAPNVYTVQLYDRTAGSVVGSKSFQILSYAGQFQWTNPAGAFINANAAGLATNVTATLTNNAGVLYGTWNGDSIKQITIEQDSGAGSTLGTQVGVTTTTDSSGNVWNIATYTDAVTGAPGIKLTPKVAGASLPVNGTIPIPFTVSVPTGKCTAVCVLRTTITPLHGIAESITDAAMDTTATNGLDVFGYNISGNSQPYYTWSNGAYSTATTLGTPRYAQAMYATGTNNAVSGQYTSTITVNNTGGSAAISNIEFVLPASVNPNQLVWNLGTVTGTSNNTKWTIHTQNGASGTSTDTKLGPNAFSFASTSATIAKNATATFTFKWTILPTSFPFQEIPATANYTTTPFGVGPSNTLSNAIAGTSNIDSTELGVFSLNPALMQATISPVVVPALANTSFTFKFVNTTTGLDPNPDYISQLLISVPSAGGVYPSSVSVTSPDQGGVTWHANATGTAGQYLIDLCAVSTAPNAATQASTPCAGTTDTNALPPGDELDVTFNYTTAPGVSSNNIDWTVVGANGGGVVNASSISNAPIPVLDVANTTAETSFTYAGGYTATPVYPPVAPIQAVPSNSQPVIGAWSNYTNGNGYVYELYNNGSTPITDVSISLPSSNTSGQIFDTQDWSLIASSIYTYGAGANGAQCSGNGYKTLTEPVRGSPGTPGILTLSGCNIAVGQKLDVFFYALSPYDINSTFSWPASVADNGTPANPATNANTLPIYSLSNTIRVIDEAALSIELPSGGPTTFTYSPALYGNATAPSVSCGNCTFTSAGTYPMINLNTIMGTFAAQDALAASVYSDSSNGWSLSVSADVNPTVSAAGGPALSTWVSADSSKPASGTYTRSVTASPGTTVPTSGTLSLSSYSGAVSHQPVDNLMSYQVNVGATVLSATQTDTITLTYTLVAN